MSNLYSTDPAERQAALREFAAVNRAIEEIEADIACGVVPATVGSFAELHDYVDANEYGGAFETDWSDSDAHCAFWSAVQSRVDSWLKAK
jgi:hypothetical protein